MANGTGVQNFQRICIAWRDKVERVATDTLVGNRFRDLRHVTSGAFAARTPGLVVPMPLDGHRMGADPGIGAMAIEARGMPVLRTMATSKRGGGPLMVGTDVNERRTVWRPNEPIELVGRNRDV
jgi:hypothetical protein